MATPLSPQQLSVAVHRMHRKLMQRRADALRWMAYFRGEQGALLFASEDFRESAGHRYDGFSDNWCSPVAEAGAERIALRGIKLPGTSLTQQSPEEKAIWGAMQDNGVDAQLAQGFLHSAIQRRAFVSVWGRMDTGAPLISAESATQAIVEYDAEYRWQRRFGMKNFADDEFEYTTFQDANFVYKLRRPLGSVDGIRPSGLLVPGLTGTDWSLMTEQPVPNHLGMVSIVELPYLPMLEGEPMSAISGVAAMQDAINLLWAYVFNLADFTSLPGRVVMGQQPPKIPLLDSDGQKIGEQAIDPKEVTKGRILWLTGQNAKIDAWDAADPKPLTDIIEQAVGHVAAQTRTPPHYLVSNKGISNLSGDALKAAETGLVMKVLRAQEHYDGRVQDIVELIARQLRLPDDVVRSTRRTRIQWRDVENRSDSQKADALQKKQTAGYPLEWLLIEDGKSPDEIETIMSLVRKQRREQAEDEMAVGIQAAVQNAISTA